MSKAAIAREGTAIAVTVCEFAGGIAVQDYYPADLAGDTVYRLAVEAATELGWERAANARGGWRKIADAREA